MPKKQCQSGWPKLHPDTPLPMNSPTDRCILTRLLSNATITHGGSYQ